MKTCISEIKGHDYSQILYIAPTPRKIKGSQKALNKLIKGVYIPPDMLTIKQFSKRIYSLYGNKTLISKALVPVIISRLSGKNIGFSTIISNFINEIKQYRPDRDIKTIRTELEDLFKKLNVPEEGAKRAIDAVDIFEIYQEALNTKNVLDDNDVLIQCPELIEKSLYSPDLLILDGFYEITPVEKTILKKLIENSKMIRISIPYDEKFAEITESLTDFIRDNFAPEEIIVPFDKRSVNIAYTSYPSIDEETEAIARHIKNLFISGKNRILDNIIVTFPKLDMYSDITERIFRRYGIPCDLSPMKHIGHTRPFLDILAMLESVDDDYPRLVFSQFLISPYFKKITQILRKFIPQVSLKSGIIKGKESWIHFQGSGLSAQDLGIKDDVLSEISNGLRLVLKKLALLESMKDSGTYTQFSTVLSRLLENLAFSASDIDFTEQVAPMLKELSIIDDLIPACTNISLRQFIDSLKYILNSIETEAEGVQVAGFFELRGIEPEYLYFGGLKDGDMPLSPDIDHILPDSVRTGLGLVNMKRYLNLQKFLFQKLTGSAVNMHLSYPAMEADKLFLPSPFLPWEDEVKEETPGILCMEERLINEGKDPLFSHIKEIRNIGNAFINKRFGKNKHIWITDIDNYKNCPRKFFIEKILKIEPSKIKEYEIEPKLLGSIIHEVMEKLLREGFADLEDMKKKSEKLLPEILHEKPVEKYWKKLLTDSFLEILPEVYKIEKKLKEEGYSFMEAELKVEGEVIKGIKLRGKIDRVDIKSGGAGSTVTEAPEVEIIDYKTGNAQIVKTDVLTKGATLQLFLYAILMKSLGFKANRVGIYSLKDIKVTWVPGGTDSRTGRTIEDYITASLKYLEEILTEIRKGNFTASPLADQTCRNCYERPYCPYIQIS
ncbi:MAG: PD-(D/E)XK nuclease family protein [Nitrospirae bacterium]|nr:PD-(D/E)XK nuclease family protein [Nitrospirota bacterium]